MKYRAFSDLETGWAFNCQVQDGNPNRTVEGGLVLNNVTHQGHRFADEIRVIGFWLEWEEKRYVQGVPIAEPVNESVSLKSKFFTLSSEYFEISDIEVLDPKDYHTKSWGKYWETFRNSESALGFGHFPFYFGIQVKYKSKADIFADITNFDKQGIEIRQTHLFSKYSSMPPHEPSGGLTATRLHPLINMNWTENTTIFESNSTRRYLNSIRFDYLLHVNLDRHHDLQTNKMLSQIGNHAGVFKDEESPDVVGAIGGYIEEGTKPASGLVFSAIEKPLLLEICAKGLSKGSYRFSTLRGKVSSWDNIHMWGARQGSYPSTPGAFHALHLHWRWGKGVSLAKFGKEPQFIKGGFEKIFEENHWDLLGKLAEGIPLVDPNCWIQTLSFAIVHNLQNIFSGNHIEQAKLSSFSTKKFEDQFMLSAPEGPKLISQRPLQHGADLLLWVSMQVHRGRKIDVINQGGNGQLKIETKQITNSMNGALFIHGIFFPHEAEGKGKEVGSTKELYWPTEKHEILKHRQWERY